MDSAESASKTNPFSKSNIISKTFFLFLIKYIRKCRSGTLSVTDLFKMDNKDSSHFLTHFLQKNWDAELHRAKERNVEPSLMRTIFRTFWTSMFPTTFQMFILGVFMRPFLVYVFYCALNSFSSTNNNYGFFNVYFWPIILVILTFLFVLLSHHNTMQCGVLGMRIKVAVSGLVYKKILRVDVKALSARGSGSLINLFSSDVGHFDRILLSFNYFLQIPFLMAMITYLLWYHVQGSALAGISVMFLYIVVIGALMSIVSPNLRRKQMIQSDVRVKLTSNTIFGIQTIKMYAWEKPFSKIIQVFRLNEIKLIRNLQLYRFFIQTGKLFVCRLGIFATLICYILLGNSLNSDVVFAIYQYFYVLQRVVVVFSPNFAIQAPVLLVAVKRIQNFLLLDENLKIEKVQEDSVQFAVEVKDVDACWKPKELVLKGLNFRIPHGKLCAIVGQVGSGKSTLLQLMLDELKPISGQVLVNGRISYCSQKPWLFSATARQNILFCERYDMSKYENVVKVCALNKDFQQFPKKDHSIIGERGVSLSGGQKARINLARTVYQEADIYIFDDPLSALDTSVSKEIFSNCIQGFLKDKTRILVTHQIQYLKDVDYIIILKEGEIVVQGTYEELSKIDNLLKKNLSQEEPNSEVLQSRQLKKTFLYGNKLPIRETEEKRKIISNPIWKYFQSTGNYCLIFIVFFLFIFIQILLSASDFWLRIWSNDEEIRESLNKTFYTSDLNPTNDSGFFDVVFVHNEETIILKSNITLYIYSSLVSLIMILIVVEVLCSVMIYQKASKNLYKKMFDKVINSPLGFFHSNTSGQILNRFSKDLQTVDENFPFLYNEFLQVALLVLGFLVNAAISDWRVCIFEVILFSLIFTLRKSFVACAKEASHLESEIKSKVFYYVNATIDGLPTIRSCKSEEILEKQFHEHQDIHSPVWYLILGSSSFFGLIFDGVCILFIVAVIGIIIVSYQNGAYNAAWAGFLLSQTLSIQGLFQYVLKTSSDVFAQIVSIERVLEYCYLKRECDLKKERIKDWPTNGLIEYRNLYARYQQNGPYSLQNINITIHPGEKIGIVGRTGAGKSTFVSSLFRLLPLEGSILIDGVDTKTIDLTQLRTSISIIPQDSVLFLGSIRYNLDPFDEHPDEILWEALRTVELGGKVNNLQQLISEEGNNFSFGERQLFCLARAIIRNNPILILDEATANIDQETDGLIQRTIREKFNKCTVLTIAHRLNTIIDSDRIIVLENGKIVEDDHPYLLLQKKEGHFMEMVRKVDLETLLNFKSIASDSFFSI